nr:retrovirus-related Pol polyprotein from transposon TNT 1-94 [Tanacetum cinerariifolium]
MAMPVTSREPKRIVNQSVAKPLRKTIALESNNQKPRNTTRKLYEHVMKFRNDQIAPILGYGDLVQGAITIKRVYYVEGLNHNLFSVGSRGTDLYSVTLQDTSSPNLICLMAKATSSSLFFLSVGESQTKVFSNEDYPKLQKMVTTSTHGLMWSHAGLNHNLFSVGQFCDADLEVAFRKSTCFIRDLKGNDLLTGFRGTDLHLITLQSINSPNPICLMAKASSSQAWLWHRRLSHLNFNTINLLSKNDIVVGLPKLKFIKDHLCSSYELRKAKRKSFHSKLTPRSKRRLHLLHMGL